MLTEIKIESRLPVRWGQAEIQPFLGGRALAAAQPITVADHLVTIRLAEPITEAEADALIAAFNTYLAGHLVVRVP